MTTRSGTAWNERVKLWPSSLPDETLFSVVSRHHALTRGSLSKQTIGPLFGKGMMLFAGGFPTGLGQLAIFLQSASSIWTVDKLIRDFTFVPYLQFFYRDDVIKQIRRILEGQDGRGIKTILGWVASRLGAAEPLRACSACHRDDLAKYGRSYWHRAHQLPGVGVCHIHRIKLIHIPGPSEEYKRFVPLIPPEDIYYRPQEIGGSLDIKFSQWSNEFLQNPPSRIDKNLLRAIYIEQLSELGFVTKSGRVRQRELLPWLRSQLLNIHLALLPLQASSFAEKHDLNWVMKLLRKPRGTAHPAKHILLLTLLFGDIHAFRNKLETCQSQRDKRASNNDQKQTANYPINNLSYMPFPSLRAWSAQTGRSVTTLAVECIRQGWPVKRRPKRLTDALMIRVKLALETGMEFDALKKRLGLSLSTLYRILRAYPESQMIRNEVLFERELKQRRRNLKELLSESPPVF